MSISPECQIEPPRRRRLWLGMLLVANLGLACVPFSNWPPTFYTIALMAWVCGQAALATLWGAWGPGALWTRATRAALLISVSVACQFIMLALTTSQTSDSKLILIAIVLAGAGCVVFGAVRVIAGWRILRVDWKSNPAAAGGAQFGLAHIFVEILLAGLIMGLARLLGRAVWERVLVELDFAALWAGVFLACALVPAVPVVGLVLDRDRTRRSRWLIALVTALVMGAAALAHFFQVQKTFGELILLLASFYLYTAANFAVVRLAGYELVTRGQLRESRRSAIRAAEPVAA